MENRFLRSINGQELNNGVLRGVFDEAALADDRVLWELLRTLPGSATPQKAIVPYRINGDRAPVGLSSSAIVQGGVADGSVRVMPFRAIVGSTALVGADALEHMRGIRSGYFYDSSALYKTVAITPNPSGNPRWTLVYAIVAPEVNGDTATQLVKDPASGVMSSTPGVVLNKRTTVTVATVDGATSATPARPALPADGAGLYHIPLAYLLVPAGFTLTSIVQPNSIHEDAPIVTLSGALGVASSKPANQSHKVGGTVDARQNSTGASVNRPGAYLPSTMAGGEKRTILLQMGIAPKSHQDGDIVDDTIDWRNRYFFWKAAVKAGTTTAEAFASDRSKTGTSTSNGWAGAANSSYLDQGCGQSFENDGFPTSGAGSLATCNGIAARIRSDGAGSATLTGPILYVRSTDGALMLTAAVPGSNTFEPVQVVLDLEATAPWPNYK